jgi:hypothetical protein
MLDVRSLKAIANPLPLAFFSYVEAHPRNAEKQPPESPSPDLSLISALKVLPRNWAWLRLVSH